MFGERSQAGVHNIRHTYIKFRNRICVDLPLPKHTKYFHASKLRTYWLAPPFGDPSFKAHDKRHFLRKEPDSR